MSATEWPDQRAPRAPERVAEGVPEVTAILDEVTGEPAGRSVRHGAAYRLLWRELREMALGGKHFRGRLVIDTYTGLGGQRRSAAARLGAAFELLHAGFLAHDDLIDHDTVRRGLPTLATEMGAAATTAGADAVAAQHFADTSAVLAGDLAIALAHKLVAQIEAPAPVRAELTDLLWETVFVSVAGELDDVAAGHGLWEISTEKVLTTAAEKTAFYSFQAPLVAAAVLAQAPRRVREPLDVVGHALGQAFQLADDLLGVFAPESVTGKSALSDLREGKATTLMLHARGLEIWERIGPDVGRSDLDEATGAHIRGVLAASDAPGRVDGQAREQLAVVRRVLSATSALEPIAEVVRSASMMVEHRLDEAARYASEAAAQAHTAHQEC